MTIKKQPDRLEVVSELVGVDDDDDDGEEEEEDSMPRFHTLAWRRRRKKKFRRRLVFDSLPMKQDPSKALKVVPTVALPFVADVASAQNSDQKNGLENCATNTKKKKKKKLKTQLTAVVKFASATLGRSLGVHDNLAARARIRALAWSAETYRQRTSEQPVPHEISETAMVYLRETFRVQCTKGALKRPVIHVEFDYPRSLSACCNCSSEDFLFVFVGLFNIFVVQWVLVVIMFFADKEIDLNSLETYYSPPPTLFQ